jgi:arabinoxylan arabinofuranohydrolase
MVSKIAALALMAALGMATSSAAGDGTAPAPGSNPIIRDKFTADPAPLVVGDRLFLYTGHDEAQRDEMFNMREWLVYSTTDMKTWTAYPPIMRATDFKWAKKDAWASQAIEKNGKFYFYAAVEHDSTHPGKAIAVAVSTRPLAPCRCAGVGADHQRDDAQGSA